LFIVFLNNKTKQKLIVLVSQIKDEHAGIVGKSNTDKHEKTQSRVRTP
jgi:hypothetical protein